jgi:hypothetical protein
MRQTSNSFGNSDAVLDISKPIVQCELDRTGSGLCPCRTFWLFHHTGTELSVLGLNNGVFFLRLDSTSCVRFRRLADVGECVRLGHYSGTTAICCDSLVVSCCISPLLYLSG